MIFDFFTFLNDVNVDYCLLNGYEDVITQNDVDSDIDILFKKIDFTKIEKIIKEFCMHQKLQLVQLLHHDLWAKNIFLYNPRDGKFLNLDLYGELSRKKVVFFEERDIFNSLDIYKCIPILSSDKEFVSYLIKKLDKNDLTCEKFDHLRSLYIKNEIACERLLAQFFPSYHAIINEAFSSNNFTLVSDNRDILITDICSVKSADIKRTFLNIPRTIKRIVNPTGFTISFLGPDGSGKSTIINELLDNRLPFRRKEYFHLKPIKSKSSSGNNTVVTDPHKHPPYSKLKSYIKLLYFVYQYNVGWFRNIIPLKIKSSLVIFDRYFDDILVDNKRYRYDGSLGMAKLARIFIQKPDIYFVLTADAKVIYERKQEVPFDELERQTEAYESMADGKRYFKIDVNRSPEEITKEIVTIMMEKMNDRY